ncbi:hypothetical protein HY494_02185 [Candidatus Woesearchaeota archaeon]|nr:hypothetical protein [Candidatus Woesearchaeota archaeon]
MVVYVAKNKEPVYYLPHEEPKRRINIPEPPTDMVYQTDGDIENQKQWDKLADLYS